MRGRRAHALLHLGLEVLVLDVAHEVLFEENLQVSIDDREPTKTKANVDVTSVLHQVNDRIPDCF